MQILKCSYLYQIKESTKYLSHKGSQPPGWLCLLSFCFNPSFCFFLFFVKSPRLPRCRDICYYLLGISFPSDFFVFSRLNEPLVITGAIETYCIMGQVLNLWKIKVFFKKGALLIYDHANKAASTRYRKKLPKTVVLRLCQ